MSKDNSPVTPPTGCMATFIEHTNPDGTKYYAATCPFAMSGRCGTFPMPDETWDMDPNDPELPIRRKELKQEVADARQNCPGPKYWSLDKSL